MNKIEKRAWARIYRNRDLNYIESISGYRGGTHTDPKGYRCFLGANPTPEQLGRAVLDALGHSRWVLASPREGSTYPHGVDFDSEVYDQDRSAERYESWIKYALQNYGYNSRDLFFKEMRQCSVERIHESMIIAPSHHDRLEGWAGFRSDDERIVRIHCDCSPGEVGVALELAFSYCT